MYGHMQHNTESLALEHTGERPLPIGGCALPIGGCALPLEGALPTLNNYNYTPSYHVFRDIRMCLW